MNWQFWRKKKGDGVTRTETKAIYTNTNLNATNTCITTQAGEGGMTYLHIDSPDPAIAEAIYLRVYEKLKSDVKKQRGFE